jgi:chemotaxis protein methyltransferase CheR
VKELRSKVKFQRLNFMDSSYNVDRDFDIIFCRNVLIYFDRETQQSVINKLCDKLKTGGIFFLGHSESISNMDVPLRQIRPTIFQKI